MSRPLVSVLVTTYNHEAYLEQALDSVLAQDLTDYELVITDDCSTDGSARRIVDWVARSGVEATVILNERNLGLCTNRNRALARSSGQFVCTLAGDDFYAPDRLTRQARFLADQPAEAAMVYGDVAIVDPNGRVEHASYLSAVSDEPPVAGRIFARLQEQCFIPAVGVMMRRSALEAVGGWDESLAFEDWDMWLRLSDRFEVAHLGGPPVASWRRLPTSMYHSGFSSPPMQESVGRLHAKWLDRDERSRIVAARWVRDAALNVAPADAAAARRLVAATRGIRTGDRVPWRLVEGALALPGAGRAVRPLRRLAQAGAAAIAAERAAWNAGRRVPRRRVGSAAQPPADADS